MCSNILAAFIAGKTPPCPLGKKVMSFSVESRTWPSLENAGRSFSLSTDVYLSKQEGSSVVVESLALHDTEDVVIVLVLSQDIDDDGFPVHAVVLPEVRDGLVCQVFDLADEQLQQ